MQCAIIFSVMLKSESKIELIEFTILMHTYKSRVFLFSIKNWVGGGDAAVITTVYVRALLLPLKLNGAPQQSLLLLTPASSFR